MTSGGRQQISTVFQVTPLKNLCSIYVKQSGCSYDRSVNQISWLLSETAFLNLKAKHYPPLRN